MFLGVDRPTLLCVFFSSSLMTRKTAELKPLQISMTTRLTVLETFLWLRAFFRARYNGLGVCFVCSGVLME